ncbi:hypothetical protein [Saccharothrix syringae]|uniref:Uncharacterized protein n=1 Tax=Saccharothrix syringae TaxID=103733 RepID=A0A5Q0GU82_SACSY|nr:hypothetical protein [Saccharothrix syringae]QFZ17060.1 hypothetical protein EKG83_05865 [Saccharothrix syringae]
MNHIRARRAGSAAAALLLGLVAAPPAWAATPAGVASVGSAEFTKGDVEVDIATLAPCAVDGVTSASSEAVVRQGVRFGPGKSTCTTTVVDPVNDTTTTTSEATGTEFELSALVSAGGPRLRVGKWRVTCTATDRGTSTDWALNGLQGFPGLPDEVPPDHHHEVKAADGTVLAVATFNSSAIPEQNDGSMALTLLRITFTEAAGTTGQVTLGTTACSPTP